MGWGVDTVWVDGEWTSSIVKTDVIISCVSFYLRKFVNFQYLGKYTCYIVYPLELRKHCWIFKRAILHDYSFRKFVWGQCIFIWRALIQWSPRPACSGGSHWRQPTGVYICMRHAAANHRYGMPTSGLHMYEITRRRPITATAAAAANQSYTYVRNTSRPITATAAIQCLHMYERRRSRSLKPTSVYESRRGGSLMHY